MRPPCHLQNIEVINSLPTNDLGWDLILVSTSSHSQRDYWIRRLDETRGKIISPHARVIVVIEEWNGGAGNGLGTLLAVREANVILAREGKSVQSYLATGASVALFHTAGKGTRLAPLPGAEYNNKSSVKLPGFTDPSLYGPLITILEAVLKQTSLYAATRKGRLSVFWGDQIFIPSAPVDQLPIGHIEVLGVSSNIHSEAEWIEKKMDHYGLLWDLPDGTACQMEKISFQQYSKLKQQTPFSSASLATSLGCFNISPEILTELLNEFHKELDSRTGCLNTDQDFWMPLTLDWNLFSETIRSKKGDPARHQDHYNRMQKVKKRMGSGILLHAIKIPQDSYWWDFGQMKTYQANSLRSLENTIEGKCLRAFFFLPNPINGSIIINSSITNPRISQSVLIDVHAQSVDLFNSILIHATAPKISGKEVLLYNVLESEQLSLTDKSVRADIIHPGQNEPLKMITDISRNGGDDWTEKLTSNPLSYADLYQINQQVDIDLAENLAKVRHQILRENHTTNRNSR